MGVECNFHFVGMKQSLAHTPKAKHNHKEPNLLFFSACAHAVPSIALLQ